jgi:hypothetical protein
MKPNLFLTYHVSYHKYKEFNYVKHIPLSFTAYECISPVWNIFFCKSNRECGDCRIPPKYSKHLPVLHGTATLKPYLLTYAAEPFLRSCNCAAIQEIPSNFKEPEGSSPCSQEPSTGPYPEPVRSSP